MTDSYMPAIRALLNARDDEGIVTAYPVWPDGMRAVIFAVVPGDDYPEQKINRVVERMMSEGTTPQVPLPDSPGDAP